MKLADRRVRGATVDLTGSRSQGGWQPSTTHSRRKARARKVAHESRRRNRA